VTVICSPGDEDRPMTFVMVKSGAISLLITATCSYTLGVEAVLQETFPFKGDMVCLTVFLSPSSFHSSCMRVRG
jgi:hypothetical protein